MIERKGELENDSISISERPPLSSEAEPVGHFVLDSKIVRRVLFADKEQNTLNNDIFDELIFGNHQFLRFEDRKPKLHRLALSYSSVMESMTRMKLDFFSWGN
jgi:hypothetical protein